TSSSAFVRSSLISFLSFCISDKSFSAKDVNGTIVLPNVNIAIVPSMTVIFFKTLSLPLYVYLYLYLFTYLLNCFTNQIITVQDNREILIKLQLHHKICLYITKFG